MKLVVLLVLLLTATGCTHSTAPSTVAQSEPHTLTAAEKAGISGARKVRKELTDPDSFRVSSVKIVQGEACKWMPSNCSVLWVCIEGRSKNEMGGYTPLEALAYGSTDSDATVLVPIPNFRPEWNGRLFGNNIDVTDAVKAALKADREKE